MFWIRESSAEAEWGYLKWEGGTGGPFVRFLEQHGLKNGLQSLPHHLTLEEAIQEGWLAPSLRVSIPETYYLAWRNFPCMTADIDEEAAVAVPDWSGDQDLGVFWEPDGASEEWFLHPYDQTSGSGAEFRNRGGALDGDLKAASLTQHPSGSWYPSWVDYFPYWQVYRLADLIGSAVVIGPRLNLKRQAETMAKLAADWNSKKKTSDAWLVGRKKLWDKAEPFFAALCKYRVMCSIAYRLSDPKLSPKQAKKHPLRNHGELKLEGTRKLTDSLGVTPEFLVAGMKESLLFFAAWWTRSVEGGNIYYKGLLENLKMDAYLVVQWLSVLQDCSFDEAAATFDYPRIENHSWAPLREFLGHPRLRLKEFLRFFGPHYIKHLNESSPKRKRLTDDRLQEVVGSLLEKCPPFTNFCLSMERMSEATETTKRTPIRVDSTTLMDELLILAVRAEAVLSWLHTGGMTHDDKPLRKLLVALAHTATTKTPGLRQAVNHATDRQVWDRHTDQRQPREELFSEIKVETIPRASNHANDLMRAMLTLGATRNYCAHHYGLDSKMVVSHDYAYARLSIFSVVLWFGKAWLESGAASSGD